MYRLMFALMLGMGLGGAAGAKFSAHELSEKTLKLGFSAFVFVLGIITGRSAIMNLSR